MVVSTVFSVVTAERVVVVTFWSAFMQPEKLNIIQIKQKIMVHFFIFSPLPSENLTDNTEY